MLITVGIAGAALAATAVGSTRVPGGPAPKPLVGTWRTTLTTSDLERLAAPDAHRSYTLAVANTKYLAYPRALGFGPTGSGRDTVPFGFTGHLLYLACLDDNGSPIAGYATYSWSIAKGALRFRRVAEPCRGSILRDRILILTSHPWRKQ
jgi:hypothetical protein